MAITHPDHPAPIVEGRCNALLWNCKGPDCDYHYPDPEMVVCPVCETPRRRCTAYPIKGRDACKFHGGRALQGIAHPHFEGKGLSKHLPTRFLQSWNELSADERELLNQNEQIKMLHIRLEDITERIFSQDESLGRWSYLQELMQTYQAEATKYRHTQNARHSRRMVEILNELQHIILDGSINEEWAWEHFQDIVRTIDKLVGTEIKRRTSADSVITKEQFQTMMAYITNSINTRITDIDERMAVLADINQLFT